MDIRIAGKFRLGRKIGGGSFGDIYLGADLRYAPYMPDYVCFALRNALVRPGRSAHALQSITQ